MSASCIHVAACACLYANPYDSRHIKLSWTLALSWFFLLQACERLQHCANVCEGAFKCIRHRGAKANVCATHLSESVCKLVCVFPCAWLSVYCVRVL